MTVQGNAFMPQLIRVASVADSDTSAPTPHRYVIARSDADLKVIGFTMDERSPVARTGTSRPDVPLLTTGMGPCIAVAVGAESTSVETGEQRPRAKAALYHISTGNDFANSGLREYIQDLKDRGLNVKVALIGGSNQEPSKRLDHDIRALLDDVGIAPDSDFDRTCASRNIKTDEMLGVVITPDHRIRFISELAALASLGR
jgi:hypothetical protein